MDTNLARAIQLSRPLHWEYNANDHIFYLIDSDSDEILKTCITNESASNVNYALILYHANIQSDALDNSKLTDRMPF